MILTPTPVLSFCPDTCSRHTCLDPLPVLVRCFLARVPTPITRFLPRRLCSALTKAYPTAPTVLRPPADPCSELVQTAVLDTLPIPVRQILAPVPAPNPQLSF